MKTYVPAVDIEIVLQVWFFNCKVVAETGDRGILVFRAFLTHSVVAAILLLELYGGVGSVTWSVPSGNVTNYIYDTLVLVGFLHSNAILVFPEEYFTIFIAPM